MIFGERNYRIKTISKMEYLHLNRNPITITLYAVVIHSALIFLSSFILEFQPTIRQADSLTFVVKGIGFYLPILCAFIFIISSLLKIAWIKKNRMSYILFSIFLITYLYYVFIY